LSNGNAWIADKHDHILRAWAGRIRDAEIGTITGHSERTVRENRKRLGLPAFHPRRIGWGPREFALAAGAGMWSPLQEL
jgi:hypothetical protein